MIPFRPPHEARYCNYVNSQVSNRNLSVYIFKVALHPELSRAAIKCNPQEHTFVFVHKYACIYILQNVIVTIPVITFTHGIYNYIPETNHVSTVYNVAAVLYLQFGLHVMLFRL